MTSETDWLDYQSRRTPDKPAIIDDSNFISYRNLNDRVNCLSAFFIKKGIKPGDIVPVLVSHNAHFIISVLALWRIGVVAAPLSKTNSKAELKNLMTFIESRVFVSDEAADIDLPGCKRISPVCTGSETYAGNSLWGARRDGNAIIIFTSGTSSTPKGVLISFNGLYNSFVSVNSFDNYSPDDIFLASLPFNHIGGFSIIVRCMLAGGTLALPVNTSHIGIAEGMLKFNPSILSLVPTVLSRLMNSNIKPNTNLRSVYIGGGPSTELIIKKSLDAGYPIVKVYGSTETIAMVTAYRLSESSENIRASGFALQGNQVIIVDKDNIPVDPGDTGEIVIESQSLFTEYFRNNLETNRKKKNYRYYTGDIGYVDEFGLLTVLMRRTDLIISGGENIYPAEIENELAKIKFIKECCVIGVEDNEWGQTAVGVIVAGENTAIDEKQIRSYLLKSISAYKIPKIFIQLNSIPKNEMGKPDRRKLLDAIQQDDRISALRERSE